MIDLVNASVGDKGKIVIFNMVRDDEADEVYKSMEFVNSLQLITKSPELDSVITPDILTEDATSHYQKMS